MSNVDPLTEYFEQPSARLALELAREDRKMLADLVALRKSRGVSQDALARRIGVSQATISEFERLGNDPKLSTIRRYARALGAMIRHQVDRDGVVDGSEDLTHFAASGVSTTLTAAALARRAAEHRTSTMHWNSGPALQATRQRGVGVEMAEASS